MPCRSTRQARLGALWPDKFGAVGHTEPVKAGSDPPVSANGPPIDILGSDARPLLPNPKLTWNFGVLTPRVSSSRLCFVNVPCACTDSRQATTTEQTNSGEKQRNGAPVHMHWDSPMRGHPWLPCLFARGTSPCPGLSGSRPLTERNNTTRLNAHIPQGRDSNAGPGREPPTRR